MLASPRNNFAAFSPPCALHFKKKASEMSGRCTFIGMPNLPCGTLLAIAVAMMGQCSEITTATETSATTVPPPVPASAPIPVTIPPNEAVRERQRRGDRRGYCPQYPSSSCSYFGSNCMSCYCNHRGGGGGYCGSPFRCCPAPPPTPPPPTTCRSCQYVSGSSCRSCGSGKYKSGTNTATSCSNQGKTASLSPLPSPSERTLSQFTLGIHSS